MDNAGAIQMERLLRNVISERERLPLKDRLPFQER